MVEQIAFLAIFLILFYYISFSMWQTMKEEDGELERFREQMRRDYAEMEKIWERK